MSNFQKLALVLVIASVFSFVIPSFGSDSSSAQAATLEWLRADGNKIMNESNQVVTLRGANVENREWIWNSTQSIGYERRAIPELTGAPDTGWGANLVLMAFASGPVVRNDTAYLNAMDELVEIGKANGAYSLFVYRYSEPNSSQSLMPDQQAEDAIAILAARYANEPAVLYGLQVEPHDVSWTDVKPRFTSMIDAIQANNPRALIAVPGTHWSRFIDHALTDPINRSNLIYKTHPYDSFNSIQSNYRLDEVAAVYPVLVAEFGPGAFMGMDDTINLLDYAETHGMSWTAWLFNEVGCPCLLTETTNFTPSAYGEEIKARLQATASGDPVPPPLPAPSVDLISNVSPLSGMSYVASNNSVVVGAPVFIDRSYTFTSVPAEIAGAPYIVTANGDKNRSEENFLSFDISQDATVYIAYDVRASSLPNWLASWDAAGSILGTSDVDRDLFSRDFSAGTVTLGGNMAAGASGAGSAYNVIAVPNGTLPPANVAPTAGFNANPTSGMVALDVNFDASGSSDSDGSIVSYDWDFGDGSTGTGQFASHTYANVGSFTATLTVTDDDGASDSTSAGITVNSVPNVAPTASFTADAAFGEAPFDVNFDASGSSDSDGSIVGFAWDFGDGSFGNGQFASHQFGSAGVFNVGLTVTDNDGATDSASTTITVTEPVPPQVQMISLEDASIEAGQIAISSMVISDAPAGLSGFDITATISNPAIARFESVITPEFGLSAIDIVSDSEARVRVVDLNHLVETGAIDALMADLEIMGISQGDVTISIAIARMDDDSGNPMTPQTTSATISVTAPADLPPTATLFVDSMVKGSVLVSADALDDNGISQVEFFVDGASIGIDTTFPYAINWDTAGFDGVRIVSAIATDTIGQTASDSTNVTVDNTAPTVNVSSFEDGAFIAGVIRLEADATDATSGVSQVEFFVDGTSLRVDTSSPYGADWDTSAANDGSYLITATATDNMGNSASHSITLNVDGAGPSVEIISHVDGDIVVGNVTLEADAFENGSGVSEVEFFVDGVSVGSDTTNFYNVIWDSASTNDGFHNIVAVATDAMGNSTQSEVITVTSMNGVVASEAHVSDIDGAAFSQGKNWYAFAAFVVVDDLMQPVEGATVSGTWSTGLSTSCVTDVNGRCSVLSDNVRKKVGSITFTISNVSSALAYDPSANNDIDGDSNGTTITILK